MKKGNLVTIFLVILLLAVGGYYAWNYTSTKDIVLNLITGPPKEKDVNDAFPNDNTTFLGEFKVSQFKDMKGYGFLVRRSGQDEIYVLPEDFNLQDPNKRSYIRIPRGEEVDPSTEGLIFIQNQALELGKSVDFTTVHSIFTVNDGVQTESLPLFYKLKYYDEKAEDYRYFFMMSKTDVIEPVEHTELIATF